MKVSFKIKDCGEYCCSGPFLEDIMSKLDVIMPLNNKVLHSAIYHSLREFGKARALLWGYKPVSFKIEED